MRLKNGDGLRGQGDLLHPVFEFHLLGQLFLHLQEVQFAYAITVFEVALGLIATKP